VVEKEEIMTEVLITIFQVVIVMVAMKAIFIGSEFNFYYWLKYGRKYTTWYNNRPTFPHATPDHW
jgi:hypothetical protein